MANLTKAVVTQKMHPRSIYSSSWANWKLVHTTKTIKQLRRLRPKFCYDPIQFSMKNEWAQRCEHDWDVNSIYIFNAFTNFLRIFSFKQLSNTLPRNWSELGTRGSSSRNLLLFWICLECIWKRWELILSSLPDKRKLIRETTLSSILTAAVHQFKYKILIRCQQQSQKFTQEFFFLKGHAAITNCWRCWFELGWSESFVFCWPPLESTARESSPRSDLSTRTEETSHHLQVSSKRI